MPLTLPGVDDSVVDPRKSWADKQAYDAQRKKLASMFMSNFEQFRMDGMTDYSRFGPQA